MNMENEYDACLSIDRESEKQSISFFNMDIMEYVYLNGWNLHDIKHIQDEELRLCWERFAREYSPYQNEYYNEEDIEIPVDWMTEDEPLVKFEFTIPRCRIRWTEEVYRYLLDNMNEYIHKFMENSVKRVEDYGILSQNLAGVMRCLGETTGEDRTAERIAEAFGVDKSSAASFIGYPLKELSANKVITYEKHRDEEMKALKNMMSYYYNLMNAKYNFLPEINE